LGHAVTVEISAGHGNPELRVSGGSPGPAPARSVMAES